MIIPHHIDKALNTNNRTMIQNGHLRMWRTDTYRAEKDRIVLQCSNFVDDTIATMYLPYGSRTVSFVSWPDKFDGYVRSSDLCDEIIVYHSDSDRSEAVRCPECRDYIERWWRSLK